MVETYPSQVQTFKIVGRLARGVADSADPGQEPELIPMAGATVVFTPTLSPPKFRVPTAANPVTIFQESVLAVTDENGYLKIKDDTALGVVLPWGLSPAIIPNGWTWHVNISVGGNFPDSSFDIAGDPANPLDLATLIPVPASPGTDIPQWVAVVNQVTQARDEAVNAVGNIPALVTDVITTDASFKAALADAIGAAGFGKVKTVNGTSPNEAGDVTVQGGGTGLVSSVNGKIGDVIITGSGWIVLGVDDPIPDGTPDATLIVRATVPNSGGSGEEGITPTITDFLSKQYSTPTNDYSVDISNVPIGSWMLAAIVISGSDSIDTPSGWTRLSGAAYVSIGTRVFIILGKIKANGDTFVLAGNGAGRTGQSIVLYGSGGANTNTWLYGQTYTRNGSGSVMNTAPSINAEANSLVIAISLEASLAAETDAHPSMSSGWTERAWLPQIGSTPIETILVAARDSTLGGATGDLTITYQNVQASNGGSVQIEIPRA